ncbi:uncharacterized protein LOC101851788 [Aplysia californica]|uniref:Uncharacterized protein LOC101851788 n=1 Tax=Aplysia californica TaxID=6500 RepID=A0ABM0JEI9_APLCA|nr:uncharacterized protein LOC101851788 [Aplysia californica]
MNCRQELYYSRITVFEMSYGVIGPSSSSGSKQKESGAQLLARLSPRPCLTAVDPLIFGTLSQPKTSTGVTRKVIELYGSEGVGKSQLALHLAARTCLPPQVKGLSLGGLGAKVVFIDTDFKFSAFQLAVFLERLVLSAVESQSQSPDVGELKKNAESVEHQGTPCKKMKLDLDCLNENVEGNKDCNVKEKCDKNVESHQSTVKSNSTDPKLALLSGNCSSLSDKTQKEDIKPSNSYDDRTLETDFNVSNPEKGLYPQSESVVAKTKDTWNQKTQAGNSDEAVNSRVVSLSTKEVDHLVQQSLSNVQVLRVSSSQQLLVTLHSLQDLLLSDTDVSLVIIDSISAFYWHDKSSEPANMSCTEQKMKPVVEVISKLSSEFYVTFLVTKSALIGSKRKRAEDDFYQGNNNMKGTSADKTQHGSYLTEPQCEHVEFLGKSWLELQPKRIVLSRRLNHQRQTEFVASSPLWSSDRTFAIINDHLRFL